MTTPVLHLVGESPGPDDYKGLQAALARRKRRYLRMLASQGTWPADHLERLPATFRKYIIDGRLPEAGADHSKGWVRLRMPPKEAWEQRIDKAVLDAKQARYDAKSSVWADDPVLRKVGMWAPGEEDVGIVIARLLSPALDDAADLAGETEDEFWETPTFPPSDMFLPHPAPDARATAKELVRVVLELQVAQMVSGPMRGHTIDDVLRDRAAHIEIDFTDASRVVDPIGGTPASLAPTVDELLARMRSGLDEFLTHLHVPIAAPGASRDEVSEVRRDFIARWRGVVPGVDPALMLAAYGIDYATTLLALRQRCVNTLDVIRLVALHAGIAALAVQPFRLALPALSDLIAFRQELVWSRETAAWTLVQDNTEWTAPAPASPEMLADGDDFLYRTLVAQPGRADPSKERYFRANRADEADVPPAPVPPGWTWPANERAFTYWWRAVLRGHCAQKAMGLQDTADFHVASLVRFAYLFDLHGDRPSTRVPRFVADAIKATLLHFKYWFDEPAATGHDGAEMTFWSENHQVLFHSSQVLVGQLFPDDVFPRSGTAADGQPVTGREHARRGLERLERWLDHRLALGFSEWCSPVYYDEEFPAVLNVVDFCRDERIATKAAMVADILVFDLARNTCGGSFGVTAGRAYFEGKAFGWRQSVGEAIEVLFGTRRDHLAAENTAIALCSSPKYVVPDALLAIGRDRLLVDAASPMTFRSRVSINVAEAAEAGVGFESDADAAFWWGLGAYFDPATIALTRTIATRYDNLKKSNPPALLFRLELIDPFLEALLLDTAELVGGAVGVLAGRLVMLAPFPVNLVGALISVGSLELEIEGFINLIGDLATMLLDGLEAVVNAVLGEDPPKPHIPKPALQAAYEGILTSVNAGSVLGRANLYTYAAGDAMLSSVQNHMAQAISLQKHPWMASLGCDACVWTNAPLEPTSNLASAGWQVFKHIVQGQASRALGDVLAVANVGLDELKKEGLRDWGGSICLPKVAQHRSVTIAAYNFPVQRTEFSATFSHAWFPTEFFDEVVPAPMDESLLPERAGGGTWVFGRRADGYVALCSGRRARWIRDHRFDGDPDPETPGQTMGQGRFTTTELRAEDGSNIWICAIGTRAQFGSFEAFTARVGGSYLNFSGIGALGQLECTFDMPEATGTNEPGFRWELFFDDDQAHLDGQLVALDEYPRFDGPYVEGRTPGRVEWRERAYRIVHPITGLWVSHDTARVARETSPPQAAPPRSSARLKLRQAVTISRVEPSPGAARSSLGRRKRFRLDSNP